MRYVIFAAGRKYRFDTLDAAKKAASDLFTRKGIVVGIFTE